MSTNAELANTTFTERRVRRNLEHMIERSEKPTNAWNKQVAAGDDLQLPQDWTPSEIPAGQRILEKQREWGWENQHTTTHTFKRLARYRPARYSIDRIEEMRLLEAEYELEKLYKLRVASNLSIEALNEEIEHLELLKLLKKVKRDRARSIAAVKSARRQVANADRMRGLSSSAATQKRLADAKQNLETHTTALTNSLNSVFGKDVVEQNGLFQHLTR